MNRYDTFWRRFFANMVDGLVFTPIGWFNTRLSSPDIDSAVLILWAVFSYSAVWIYNVWLHTRYGQTLGKMALGVMVLDLSEKRIPSLKQAFLRELGYTVLNALSLVYFIYLVLSGQYVRGSETSEIPEMILALAGFSWFLLEIITMMTNDKRRAFHDWIANTVVVRCN